MADEKDTPATAGEGDMKPPKKKAAPTKAVKGEKYVYWNNTRRDGEPYKRGDSCKLTGTALDDMVCHGVVVTEEVYAKRSKQKHPRKR